MAIGTEARGEEDFLAAVRGIEVWDGRIYIADRQLFTIRVYDMDGNHVEDLGRQGEGPEVPDTKAWYDQIIPDRSGRIWLLREEPGHPVEGWTEPADWRGWKDDPQWVSELWYDVFDEATGRYLGRVPAPDGLDRDLEPFIDGDLFICLTRGGIRPSLCSPVHPGDPGAAIPGPDTILRGRPVGIGPGPPRLISYQGDPP